MVAVFQSCCCLAGKTSGARKSPVGCVTFRGSAVLCCPWHCCPSFLPLPLSAPLMCSVEATPKEAFLESFVSSALSFVLAEISSSARLPIPGDPSNPYMKKSLFCSVTDFCVYAMTFLSSPFNFLAMFVCLFEF